MSEEYTPRLLKAQIKQLEDRSAEQHVELTRSIEELNLGLESLAAAVLARLDAHEEYHRRGEHRWGLIKLASRHPFRLAATVGVLAVALRSVGVGSDPWLGDLLVRWTNALP